METGASPPAQDAVTSSTDLASRTQSHTAKSAVRHERTARVFEDGRVIVCVRERPFLPMELQAQLNASHEPRAAEPGSRCLSFAEDGATVTIGEPVAMHDDMPTSKPAKTGVSSPPHSQEDALRTVGSPRTRPLGASHVFRYDHAYPMATTQETVYHDMGAPVLDATFRGFNTCIFAYGQTGSGKSYSMMGADGGADIRSDPGLVPRLCDDLFQRISTASWDGVGAAPVGPHSAETEDKTGQVEVAVRVSYLEIYQEKVRSLLNEPSTTSAITPQRPLHGASTKSASTATKLKSSKGGRRSRRTSEQTSGPTLRVRQHPTLGVFVEGLQEIPVTSHEQILHWMTIGNLHRRTASTKMNDVSSRSHAVFALHVVQKRSCTLADGRVQVTERRAKVNLVDLAGSERARATGAEGETLREGAHINLSLTTLGRVIKALSDLSTSTPVPNTGSAAGVAPVRHIPYRDSTLTFLLQESLGGSSKTFMLATLSPAAQNYEETLSTLRYADRAKAIVTRAFVNESASDKRIRELEEEVRSLREQIKLLQSAGMRTDHTAALQRVLSGMLGGVQEDEDLAASPQARRPLSSSDSSCGDDEEEAETSAEPTPSFKTRWEGEDHEEMGAEVSSASRRESGSQPSSLHTPPRIPDDDGDRAESLSQTAMQTPDAESDEEEGREAAAPSSPLTAQVSQLQSALVQAEEVIRQLTESDKDREAQVAAAAAAAVEALRTEEAELTRQQTQHQEVARAALEAEVAALKQSTRTVARRESQEPYLLNVDGVGDWVVAYLHKTHHTCIGCENAAAEALARTHGDVYLVLPDGAARAIWPSHMTFRVLSDGAVQLSTAVASLGDGEEEGTTRKATDWATVSLNGSPFRSFPASATPDDETESGGGGGLLLQSGDILTVGTAQWSFRFIDPSSPPPVSTSRTMPSSHVSATTPMCGEAQAIKPAAETSGVEEEQTNNSDDPEESQADSEVRAARPVIPQLALSSLRPGPPLRRAPTLPHAAESPEPVGSSQAGRDDTMMSPRTRGGVAPLSTLPLTARGPRSREDALNRLPTRPNERSAAPAGGGVRGALRNEPARFAGQHTFCFVGSPNTGKTCTRENLRQPDTWLSYFVKESLAYPPTWGLERVALDVDGQEGMRLVLSELSGQPCFALLTDFMAWRRVTFVLCFSLEHNPSIHDVRQTLELLLCHTERRPISLFLVATHLDTCQLSRVAVHHVLHELESEVRNLCVMLQPDPELRPVIIGHAAVDNTTRRVVMSGFAKVDTFPKLLTWLSDYAYHNWRNDTEFPNGLVPEHCLLLEQQLVRMRLARKYALSIRDYRSFAASLFPLHYGSGDVSELARHTQLFASWGDIIYLEANERWRRHVVLDVQWLHLILAVIASLGRTAATPEEEEAAALSAMLAHTAASKGAEGGLMDTGRHVTNPAMRTAAPAKGSILLSSTTMRRLVRDGGQAGSRGGAKGGRDGRRCGIPFSPQKVITADLFGLLRHSIPTVPVLEALMEKLILDRDDAEASHLSGIVQVLENCDAVVRGSRLLYSPTQRRYRLLRARSQSKRASSDAQKSPMADSESEEPQTSEEERAVWSEAESHEFFFLLPFTFAATAPPAVIQHFSKFLSGPFYRFTFNVIPPLFFAKLISRLVSMPGSATTTTTPTPTPTAHPKRVYLGPIDPVMVETDGHVLPNPAAAPASTPSPPVSKPDGASVRQRVVIPSGELDLWATSAWVCADHEDMDTTTHIARTEKAGETVAPSRSRVWMRLVHHSLFLSFHNVYETLVASPSSPLASSAAFSTASSSCDGCDYDDELDMTTASTGTGVSTNGTEGEAVVTEMRLRDAVFFQNVLDTVRSLAEEYCGTQCEESILSTASSVPAPYSQAWLEDEIESHNGDGTCGREAPYYRTVDANLNSTDRVVARERRSLMTARGGASPMPSHTASAPPPDRPETADDDAVFPFLRTSHNDREFPLDSVETLLTSTRTTSTASTSSSQSCGASLHEILATLSDSLVADDAVQHSQVVDALLDVLARTT